MNDGTAAGLNAATAAELNAAVERFWTGRAAVVMINRYDGATRALCEELLRAGGRLAGAVCARRLPPGVLPGVPAWVAEEHGIVLRRSQFDDWLREPTGAVARWLDELDPRRTALVLGTSYTGVPEICHRAVHGWWRPLAARWEDKTLVDQLFLAAGVPVPPYRVMAVDDPRLPAVAAELDAGHGVILAADATRSVLGSSKGLSWVRTAEELRIAAGRLGALADRLRVATYLPGIPCSVLGMVTSSGVAAFEPFEIVTLRGLRSGRLVYCGTSTFWQPPEPLRQRAQEAARRAGLELAASSGYRGIFSLDGVCGRDGLFATELNPRHVSGLTLWAGQPGLPIRLFNRGVQEGVADYDRVTAAQLENLVGDAIRSHPAFMVKVPADGSARAGHKSGIFGVQVDQATVSCRYEGDGLRVLGVSPARPDGLAGPAVAAAAAACGFPDLAGPQEA